MSTPTPTYNKYFLHGDERQFSEANSSYIKGHFNFISLFSIFMIFKHEGM